MSNVIPLFGGDREHRGHPCQGSAGERSPEEARTHFLLSGLFDNEPVSEGYHPHMTTLCGRPAVGIVDTDHKPVCAACIEAWRALGWTFPLPAVVCTA